MNKLYDIRWALFYAGGAHKYGQWTHQPPEMEYRVSGQPRVGLERVEIHSRHMASREIRREYIVAAGLFDKFQWLVGGSHAGMVTHQGMQLPSTYYGCQIKLHDGRVCRFMINGNRKG